MNSKIFLRNALVPRPLSPFHFLPSMSHEMKERARLHSGHETLPAHGPQSDSWTRFSQRRETADFGYNFCRLLDGTDRDRTDIR